MQHYEELMICGICKMKTDIKIDAELIGVQNALNFFSSLMKKICYSLKFKPLSLKIFFAFTTVTGDYWKEILRMGNKIIIIKKKITNLFGSKY